MEASTTEHDKLLLSHFQRYTLDMMIAAADVVMYHARRNGKKRVEVAADVVAEVAISAPADS